MECPSCGAHPALYWTGPCTCSREEQEAAYARLGMTDLVIPGWEEALAAGKGQKEKKKKTLGRETG